VAAPDGAAEEGATPEAGAEPVPEGVPAALWREPETDAEPERDPEVVTEVVTDGVMEVVPEIDWPKTMMARLSNRNERRNKFFILGKGRSGWCLKKGGKNESWCELVWN